MNPNRLIVEYRNISYEHGRKGSRNAATGRPSVDNLEDRTTAQKYLDWCTKNAVDPIQFMRDRFQHLTRTIGIRPKFNALASPKLLEVWRKREPYAVKQQEEDRLHREAGDPRLQAIRSAHLLTPGQDSFKKPYVLSGRSELCLAQPDYSGGFHPSSQYCRECPSAVRCVQDTNERWGFNVVALRSGRHDLLPREVLTAIR